MNITQARNSSKSFQSAFGRCMEPRHSGPQQVQVLLVPAVVCAAFSIELGFKTLLLANNSAANGHALDRLFRRLAEGNRDAIMRRVGLDEATFDKSIAAVANAFVDWRYLYEKTGDVHLDLDFLRRLASATQEEIQTAEMPGR